jgi:hypothetical protein
MAPLPRDKATSKIAILCSPDFFMASAFLLEMILRHRSVRSLTAQSIDWPTSAIRCRRGCLLDLATNLLAVIDTEPHANLLPVYRKTAQSRQGRQSHSRRIKRV